MRAVQKEREAGASDGERRAPGGHVALRLTLWAAVTGAIGLSATLAQAQAQAKVPPDQPAAAESPSEQAPAVSPAPPPQTPPWTIVPSLSVDGNFTDNARSTPTNREADFFTTITPGIFAAGEGPRLRGTFDYSPQLVRHVQATDQDQFNQNLLGNGTLTAVPEQLFLDAQGSMSQAQRSGSRGFGNLSQIPNNQKTDVIAYSASPYARFRLGSAAATEFRYRFSQTIFNGNTAPLFSPITGQTVGAISNATQHEGLATAKTGDTFGRLQLQGLADYTEYDSEQSSLTSRHTLGVVNGSYAITRSIAALAGGGYDRLIFPHASALDTVGPTWNVGARFQPNEQQLLSLTYGVSEGQHGFNGQMSYAVTAATSVFASYSKQISAPQQQILQNLSVATQRTPGVTIDQNTGLPLSITNPNLTLQNDVFRTQTLNAGVKSDLGRNHYVVIFNRTEEQSLLGISANQSATGGSIAWNRELSPKANSVVLAGYSTSSPGSDHILTLDAGISYNIGETLQAVANYALSRTSGNSPTVLVNLLTLSVRKTF